MDAAARRCFPVLLYAVVLCSYRDGDVIHIRHFYYRTVLELYWHCSVSVVSEVYPELYYVSAVLRLAGDSARDGHFAAGRAPPA
eukprot:5514175-Pyramimonas_sp.AAC.2